MFNFRWLFFGLYLISVYINSYNTLFVIYIVVNSDIFYNFIVHCSFRIPCWWQYFRAISNKIYGRILIILIKERCLILCCFIIHSVLNVSRRCDSFFFNDVMWCEIIFLFFYVFVYNECIIKHHYVTLNTPILIIRYGSWFPLVSDCPYFTCGIPTLKVYIHMFIFYINILHWIFKKSIMKLSNNKNIME